jgi:hypothetical protein
VYVFGSLPVSTYPAVLNTVVFAGATVLSASVGLALAATYF